MLLLYREEIRQVFTMQDAIAANKKAFWMAAEGKCVVPLRPKISVPKYDAGFVFMPAYAEELETACLKVISLFPRNIDQGLISSPAQILLMDGKTGVVIAMLDGNCVTQMRTGASSGAAFDLLAKKDCRIGALIGTGGQGAGQLEAMLAARVLEEVRVYSRNAERTRAFAAQMQQELAHYGARIIAVGSADAAIDNADLLITATPSSVPVFDGTKIKPGCTISCVGSYRHDMQELDSAVLPRTAKIYFDSKEAVLSEAGDILIPLEQGIITEDDFTGDIGDVIRGDIVGRENDEEIIVYETVGFGAMDLTAATEIYQRALAAGIGTTWG